MSRRRATKKSNAEFLVDLMARLPWWAGVLLAVLSYLLLHRIAELPMTATAQSGHMGAFATQAMGRSLASFGQYVLPLICLAGAAISAWRRRERRQLVAVVADVSATGGAAALDDMTWQQFEKLVGEGFRLQGYRVAETGGGGADGGVDLVLTQGSETTLVQCKQWRALKVGVTVVRELYGVMAARGAAGGIVVTSGQYTADAKAFAEGRNIRLVDGKGLQLLIRSARQNRPSNPPKAVTVPDARAPSCPFCAKPMTQRIAKRGASAGSAFWGCTGYPTCKGTRVMG
ncbi:restriction endonuclease [Sphaerotilus mobilis]|uniref:Restriction system protein n=1 Tax=Sphaerotilus mobilis TaxID=47994 RepID=A0A4Q7LVI3_9BURK|nr:restriction endonuclease [Sphaerotilus mobilis]RZS57958.1 restriction system protein [Sphaerotilus mobilis]